MLLGGGRVEPSATRLGTMATAMKPVFQVVNPVAGPRSSRGAPLGAELNC